MADPTTGMRHVDEPVDDTSSRWTLAMAAPIKAFPAATDGPGGPILAAPTVLADGTKQFELTAGRSPMEVAPGTFVDAWTC